MRCIRPTLTVTFMMLVVFLYGTGCRGPRVNNTGGLFRFTVEPVVGALGELEDDTEIGYGASVSYAHPIMPVGSSVCFVEGSVGYARSDVEGQMTIPTGPPPNVPVKYDLSDTADVYRFALGPLFQFNPGKEVRPYLKFGASYHDYNSNIGDAHGPGLYVGGGVDWMLSRNWFFGIEGTIYAAKLSGDLDGVGVVPVLGLSVGYSF